MKESISYTFILNIVITFVFTCFAIIMGIFSYYRAFKANSIITSTIEKYEGYNCMSEEEIARKLNTISYNTPFDVTCNNGDGKCITDSNRNYKIISYELDITNGKHLNSNSLARNDTTFDSDIEKMNSTYICEIIDGKSWCATNKHYQYGVYTYMYVDLPAISQLLKIPFFSKTNIMYEFRNFHEDGNTHLDANTTIPDTFEYKKVYNGLENKSLLYTKEKENVVYTDATGEYVYEGNAEILGSYVINLYGKSQTGQNVDVAKDVWEYKFNESGEFINKNYRLSAVLKNMDTDPTYNASSVMAYGIPRHKCGYIRDYSY